MDLTTLVTACALAVDPKIMHALIWHQSGGEPWSFTVTGMHQPQVFRDVSDAVDAAHHTYPAEVAIRIGLTGLSATPRSVAAAMFAPCSNITVAARQIAELAERCKTPPYFNSNPIYCAIAAHRGSSDHPDNAFADAVRTSVANNDAPDFEMPADTGGDAAKVRPHRGRPSTTRPWHLLPRRMIASAPGSARSFRSSRTRLTVRRSAMQQAIGRQPRSKSLTFRPRIQIQLSHLLTACS
jgi:hypothetical protein